MGGGRRASGGVGGASGALFDIAIEDTLNVCTVFSVNHCKNV